jgi:hypothetical protein
MRISLLGKRSDIMPIPLRWKGSYSFLSFSLALKCKNVLAPTALGEPALQMVPW